MKTLTTMKEMKSGENGKRRFASKIKVVYQKTLGLPKKCSCQIQLILKFKFLNVI